MRAVAMVALLAASAQAEAPTQAATKTKLAALILRAGAVDEELADNLTEVLIARLVQKGGREIAGKEEFKTKLGVDDKAAAECIQNPECLGRAGTELGVTHVVVGTLGRRGGDYLYNLNLIDITTGKVENRVFELVASAKVDTVIGAVQATADKLFEPKIEPGGVHLTSETAGALVYLDEAFIGATPVRRDGVEPGAHHLRVEKEGHLGWQKEIEVPAGSTLDIKVPLAALPEKKKWPGPFAVVCLAVAAGSAVVGLTMAAISTDAPADSAVSRRTALESADKRHLELLAGWGLLGVAAGLVVTAAGVAIRYRHDLFPEKKKGLALVPAAGGMALAW
jgi:PEGA domain